MKLIFFVILWSIIFNETYCSNHTEKSHYIKVVEWIGNQTNTYLFIVVFIIAVTLCKITYEHFEIKAYVPESLLLIIIGLVFGAIYKYTTKEIVYNLTPELFFLILLPPIVLESAYKLYNRTFGEILGIVLIMAVFGTIFSFLVIGFGLYGLEKIGGLGLSPLNGNLMSILLFSSLIVAVDPVAVLAIFKDLGVDKELYFIVFGESLLNDAVTIVLYEIIVAFMELGKSGVTTGNIFLGIASFFTVSIGGLSIGVVTGLISSLFTRFKSENILHSMTLISTAYFAYFIAYSLKWSGIISMIGCGIVQASYSFQNIPKSTKEFLKEVVDISAGISEAIIFVFLGIEVLLISLQWHVGFQIWAIIMCLISRFLVVLALKFCINFVSVDQRKITWTEFFVVFYGGLRGAVAFSLVILIDPVLLNPQDSQNAVIVKNLFTTTTMLVILITVALMGTTMKPLAKLLKVKTEKVQLISLYKEFNVSIIDNLMCSLEVISGETGRNRVRTFIQQFDKNYVRKFFVNNCQDSNVVKLLKRYEQISLAIHYASTNKENREEFLIDLPESLWPDYEKPKLNRKKAMNADYNNYEMDVLKNIRKMSRISNSVKLGTFSDQIEFSINNKLRDLMKRKDSRILTKTSNILNPARPNFLNTSRTVSISLGSPNLAYITDEEFEEDPSKKINSKDRNVTIALDKKISKSLQDTFL